MDDMDLHDLSMPLGRAVGVGAAAAWGLAPARTAGRLNASCLAGLRMGHAAAACTRAMHDRCQHCRQFCGKPGLQIGPGQDGKGRTS